MYFFDFEGILFLQLLIKTFMELKYKCQQNIQISHRKYFFKNN